jgi:hypothetical protein
MQFVNVPVTAALNSDSVADRSQKPHEQLQQPQSEPISIYVFYIFANVSYNKNIGKMET